MARRKHSQARVRWGSRLGSIGLNAVLSTLRWEISGAEHYRNTWGAGIPTVFVLWHGRLLPCTFFHRGQGLATLISHHRDGEYIARIAQRWGYETLRGSSARGSTAAMRQIVRTLRRGKAVAITPDGPRGPRERMKPGALIAAQMSGAPVVPAAAGADRGWWFHSWDRFLVPKPFSRVRLAFGEPVYVPADATAADIETVSAVVEQRLAELMRFVDEFR